MSEILFKSKINPLVKNTRYVILLLGIIFLIGSMYFFNILLSPSIDRIFLSFGLLWIAGYGAFGMLGTSLFFFWWGFQYFGSYLIIYENGVKIRKPFRFFFHKFLPWFAIKEITIKKIARCSRYFNYETFYGIFFSLKDSKKILKIGGIFVNRIEVAYDLIVDHVMPVEN